MVESSSKIFIGVDLGTHYSYVGVFEDNNFQHAFGIDALEERGMRTLIEEDKTRANKLFIGEEAEEEFKKTKKQLFGDDKKKVLEFIRGKESRVVANIQKLLSILKYLFICARSDKGNKEICAIVIGMPSLYGKERIYYARLLKYLVSKALFFANTCSNEILAKAKNRTDNFTPVELTWGDDFGADFDENKVRAIFKGTNYSNEWRFNQYFISIEEEPLLALKAKTKVTSLRGTEVVLFADMGGATLDVCIKGSDAGIRKFNMTKGRSGDLGTSNFDEPVAMIFPKCFNLSGVKLRKAREALTCSAIGGEANSTRYIENNRVVGAKFAIGTDGDIYKAVDKRLTEEDFDKAKETGDWERDEHFIRVRSNLFWGGDIDDTLTGLSETLASKFSLEKPEAIEQVEPSKSSIYGFFLKIKESLRNSGIKNIDRVFLLGGGSKIDIIRPIIKKVFQIEKVNYIDGDGITVSNAIAYGAAIEANKFKKVYDYGVQINTSRHSFAEGVVEITDVLDELDVVNVNTGEKIVGKKMSIKKAVSTKIRNNSLVGSRKRIVFRPVLYKGIVRILCYDANRLDVAGYPVLIDSISLVENKGKISSRKIARSDVAGAIKEEEVKPQKQAGTKNLLKRESVRLGIPIALATIIFLAGMLPVMVNFIGFGILRSYHWQVGLVLGVLGAMLLGLACWFILAKFFRSKQALFSNNWIYLCVNLVPFVALALSFLIWTL